MFQIESGFKPQATIRVVGVGGGGGNAINNMIRAEMSHVEFIAANTDSQHLAANLAPMKVQLGASLTKGLGAGANPEIGKNAALESQEEIAAALSGADMVFVTAGMGGGTGTGAAPIIANIARSLGALTVGVVTKPFRFEGSWRMRLADQGMAELQSAVDSLITIPNQNLINLAAGNARMTFVDACRIADGVLLQAVDGITSLINVPGLINTDFADVKTIMSNMGAALMGVGMASGEGRTLKAANEAITSPLLDSASIDGATGIIVNVTGGSELGLLEIDEAVSFIEQAASEDARIIFGAYVDEAMGDAVRVTVIATGFDMLEDIAPETYERPVRRNATRADHYSMPMIRGGKRPLTPPPPVRPFTRPATPASFAAAMPVAASVLVEPALSNPLVATAEVTTTGLKAEDEYDIPAFLRRNQVG